MYGICHTSNVRSTRIGHASSVLAPEGGLENGMIVSVGDLEIGETDIRKVSEVTQVELAGKRIAIIATPEIIDSEDTMANRSLGNFNIGEGSIGDAYDLVIGDEFEISDNLITLGSGLKDLVKDAKFLTTKGLKYEAVKEAPATGVVLKINKVYETTTKNMFIKGLSYKLVHVTVERV